MTHMQLLCLTVCIFSVTVCSLSILGCCYRLVSGILVHGRWDRYTVKLCDNELLESVLQNSLYPNSITSKLGYGWDTRYLWVISAYQHNSAALMFTVLNKVFIPVVTVFMQQSQCMVACAWQWLLLPVKLIDSVCVSVLTESVITKFYCTLGDFCV